MPKNVAWHQPTPEASPPPFQGLKAFQKLQDATPQTWLQLGSDFQHVIQAELPETAPEQLEDLQSEANRVFQSAEQLVKEMEEKQNQEEMPGIFGRLGLDLSTNTFVLDIFGRGVMPIEGFKQEWVGQSLRNLRGNIVSRRDRNCVKTRIVVIAHCNLRGCMKTIQCHRF